MSGTKATEEGVEAGAVEGGIIPGGEEVVSIDEVVPMSMLEEYSKVVPKNHNVITARRRGGLEPLNLAQLGMDIQWDYYNRR